MASEASRAHSQRHSSRKSPETSECIYLLSCKCNKTATYPRFSETLTVWRTTQRYLVKPYVVKILDTEGREAGFYEQLHSLGLSRPNHTLPCEIIRSEPRWFLIMPCLVSPSLFCDGWTMIGLLEFLYQVLEVFHTHDLCPS